MDPSTKKAVQTLLRNDKSVDVRRIDTAFDILTGKLTVQIAYAGLVDPTIPRQEAAKMMNLSVRMVDYLGKKGKLKRRFVEGENRAHGYSLESIRKYQEKRLAKEMK